MSMPDARAELLEGVRQLLIEAALEAELTPANRATINTVIGLMRATAATMPEDAVERQLHKLKEQLGALQS